MDQEKAEEEPDHVVCLCCSVKTGLLLWTTSVTLLSVVPLIVLLATGSINFVEKKNIPSFCFLLLDGVAYICGLLAVILKRRRLLVICFWFSLFTITYTIVLLVLSILLITGAIGHVHFGNETTKYLVLGLLFVWYSVYALCQMVYAQMLKIYAKELQVKEEEPS